MTSCHPARHSGSNRCALVTRRPTIAQSNRLVYDEPVDIETVAKRIADLNQQYTQYAGVRPFGVSLIISGVDENRGPVVFLTDPTGAYLGFDAIAIGAGSDQVNEYLEKTYNPGISLEQGITLAIECIYLVSEDKLGVFHIKIGVVDAKTKKMIYTSKASGDLDLWTMNLDGSGKKRITNTEGYDGGAVASHDGSKMVWRAYHPDTPEKVARYRELLKENLTTPMKMELFVANAGGLNAKQITNFGCASFAPTFTPDNKKILFASNKNKCDSGTFELFLINPDGTGLEQVTDYGKFTSFPEFSPDGKYLIFASSYQGKSNYEFNIFRVDWKP